MRICVFIVQLASQFKDLLDDESTVSVPGSPDQLVREAAHGHLQVVKDILAKSPNVSIFGIFVYLNP